jgi:hypothetical protein
MKERRQLERRHIMFYSRVFDRKTGKLLGYLGNITTGGIMIISDESLNCEVDYKLRLDLPEDFYGKSILNLDAHSLWCQPDIDPNFFNTGFRIDDLIAEDRAIVEQILVDYRLVER